MSPASSLASKLGVSGIFRRNQIATAPRGMATRNGILQPPSSMAFSPAMDVEMTVVMATVPAPAAKPRQEPTSSHAAQYPRDASGANAETQVVAPADSPAAEQHWHAASR